MRAMFCLILLSLGVLACADAPVGSKKRPFTMYFVPSVDAQDIANHSAVLEEYLEKYISQGLYGRDEGFHIKSAVPTSYISVVEAFGTKKADFAAFTTSAYVLAKDIKKYNIEPIFTIARGPKGDEHSYKAQIIVRADSGISKLEDLKGKKFAFVDPASLSGFILPSQLLKDHNVVLGDYVFAQKHDNVVTMVYQKQVDAGATYYSSPETVIKNGKPVEEIRDARYRVMTQFPDVEKVVKILAFTKEVPNEPWVIRSDLYADTEMNQKVKSLVREGILSFIKTEEGKAALWTVATATNLIPANEETYAEVSKMIIDSQMDLEAVLQKK